MARYSVGFVSKTMVAVADTNAFTDNGYATFLQGGAATMSLKVNEIYIGGESASSNPTTMAFGRDSTRLTNDLEWVLGTGVNTSDVEIYGESYAGYIWANVTRLSLFGLAGELISVEVPLAYYAVVIVAATAAVVGVFFVIRRKMQYPKRTETEASLDPPPGGCLLSQMGHAQRTARIGSQWSAEACKLCRPDVLRLSNTDSWIRYP